MGYWVNDLVILDIKWEKKNPSPEPTSQLGNYVALYKSDLIK